MDSNYEIMKHRMEAEFAKCDCGDAIRRFGLTADDTCISVPFFGMVYRVDRVTGRVTAPDGSEAGYNTAMTVFDILCNSSWDAVPSGEFATLAELSSVRGGTTSPGGGMFTRYEKLFDAAPERLDAACRALGGIPGGKGDVAYRIPVFAGMDVALSFYAGDDEFPAQLTPACDRNVLKYMHYETAWFMVCDLMDRLEALMAEK